MKQLVRALNLSAESPFVLEQVILGLAHDLAEFYVVRHGMDAETARTAAADRVRQHLDTARGRAPETLYGTGMEG